MNPDEIENLQEKYFASTLLTVGAGKSSSGLDSFASWLFAGFAGVLTFIVGNLGSVSSHLPIESLRQAASIFAVTAVPFVVQKLIATLIVGAAEAAALGREVGEKAADRKLKLNLAIVYQECERAFFPPVSWVLQKSLAKMQRGDLTAHSRGLSKWVQVQTLLVVGEVGLIVWAAFTLIRGLS